MNSNDIRRMTTQAIEHEERTGATAKLLARHCALHRVRLSKKSQSDYVNFAIAYIRETPDLMDAAFQAAQQAGVLSRLQAIFDAAFEYWNEQHDFIPDNQGLVGIADDAYLTRMFMESISNIHAQQTGAPLLAVDLGAANRAMRHLIGEPIASQLDALVGQRIAGPMIQSGLQQLMSFGQLKMGMPSFGNYMSQYEIDRAVDVKMGAMGIV